jgi:ubiquinone/menaquinone biosynthesis methyltransferase
MSTSVDVRPAQTARNAARFDPSHDDVFARIATRYDRLCDIFSLFIHRHWKSRMASIIAAQPAGVLLDVASGTGDIPLRVLRKRGHRGKHDDVTLWVTDLCPQMLEMAKRKMAHDASIQFARMNAHDLHELSDASVDMFSISFGMKICDRAKVVSEAFRVLKPGGRFYCLEAARIPSAPIHWLYLKYMDWCLPFIARVAVNDRGAYDYLLRGIHEFPTQAAFADELRAAGFHEVSFENLTFGIVALHRGTKPL